MVFVLIVKAFIRIACDLLRVLLLFCGFVRGSRSEVQDKTVTWVSLPTLRRGEVKARLAVLLSATV